MCDGIRIRTRYYSLLFIFLDTRYRRICPVFVFWHVCEIMIDTDHNVAGLQPGDSILLTTHAAGSVSRS
jgi:hypothetical protein